MRKWVPSALKTLNMAISIWGGSSVCGSNVIQLGKAVGFRIVTACSPHSFDCKPPTIREDVAAELGKGVIYMAVGQNATTYQVPESIEEKMGFGKGSAENMAREVLDTFKKGFPFKKIAFEAV
ncbi:hypothetical protein GGS23DRAFT_594514 [Durotheca rogersii]|uniref:uncharacterized protein n=1 Tax=Durotheca rogersii TaxID=419775 RepID=UPI00222044E6|nr:uncharacterized protein GGS23DRAFT_594514 [Durotheca rogersii]KAI5866397.1 hypothetical protein GGS23DRAFT_594514 [Durotheca rogersii]